MTPLELGCPNCLAEDAKREKSIAGALTGEALIAVVVDPVLHESPARASFITGVVFTEAARQTLAAALGHYIEHGAPSPGLLSKAAMIGWARALAGLD